MMNAWPNLISQERMKIEPYHRKSNGMIEKLLFFKIRKKIKLIVHIDEI